MGKSRSKGKARNYALESGVVRFGRSKMYHKKAVYKFLKKKTPKKAVDNKPAFVEKKISGAKNGGTRMVRVKKLRTNFDTVDKPAAGTSTKYFSSQVRRVRPSLKPGVVAILLAGVHKGKRVVVLKQLGTGLLLVTGPFKVNGTPLRRVNQRFLLATQTSVDVSSVKVADKINDDYFRRARANKKQAKKEGDIFESKKEAYKASEERKKDQQEVDSQVLAAIKKAPEGKAIKQYLRHTFSLSKGQYPHKMVF